MSVITSIFFSQLELQSQQSQVQFHKDLPLSGCLVTPSEIQWEWPKSLCQAYLLIRISARSSIPDRPPFLKEYFPLVDDTHNYRNTFLNRVTDWRFTIVILSRTDILLIHILTCLQMHTGNHKTFAREMWCTKIQWEILRNSHVVYHTDCMHVNITNTLTTTSV